MGLLTEGRQLSWEEIKSQREQIRQYGVDQFIYLYKIFENRKHDCFSWGDEVEFTLVRFDHANKKVQLLLKAHELLPTLSEKNKELSENECHIVWHPEACNYVVEGVPEKPYGFLPIHFNTVEANMKLRRQQVQNILDKDEYILNISAFPRLGSPAFTYPILKNDPLNSVELSLFFPDDVMSPVHPRTRQLAKNLIARRKAKISVNIPIYPDTNTTKPFREDLSIYGVDSADYTVNCLDDHIHLDSSSSGWGCSCLQVTFQAECLEECGFLYDQLIPLTPIMLALSAACPIWRGYLADIDCRWKILCESADDRTLEEQGLKPLKNDRFTIKKSRFASTDCYISESSSKYNDIKVVVDQKIFKKLISNDIDETLAQHIAHIFIRDPLVILEEQLHPKEGETNTYHFE
ncbi:unnamed protein product, partial [Didymodactylos carnosus]